jgi:hypothetical protein
VLRNGTSQWNKTFAAHYRSFLFLAKLNSQMLCC